MIWKRHAPVVALVAGVILIQLLTAVFNANYYLTQLTMSAFYGLVVIGLCLLLGYCGQISMGQAGFFAIGGYTTAFLTKSNFVAHADEPLVAFLTRARLLIAAESTYGEPLLYVSPWVAFVTALVITGTVAYLIGMPVLKLRGHYLAMATLGFGTIVYRVVLGTRGLGAADGLTGVPAFPLLPGIAVSGSFKARVMNYYIAWSLVTVGMVVVTNLIRSRVGRALRSLHGSEDAAGAMGVDTAKAKLSVFVIGALFAAVGGIFMTHYNGGIGPSEASVLKSVRYVAIVAIGGMANLWGALLLGVVLNFFSLRGAFGSYDDAVFGIVLIAIMVFAPQGLLRTALVREIRSFAGRILTRGERG